MDARRRAPRLWLAVVDSEGPEASPQALASRCSLTWCLLNKALIPWAGVGLDFLPSLCGESSLFPFGQGLKEKVPDTEGAHGGSRSSSKPSSEQKVKHLQFR